MISNPKSPEVTPGAEQKKLAVFLGKWRTTGEVAAYGKYPAEKVDAVETYEWYPGEFFLIHNVDGKVGDETIKSQEILGHDPSRQSYFASCIDSVGRADTEELQSDGNTWTWRGSNVMGVKEHRCTAVISDDGKTIKAKHERSDDGKTWALWMDVTLTRQS